MISDITAEIESYNKYKNLKMAADHLGIKWQTLYYRLKSNGFPVTGDKERYGTNKDRLAAKGESMFQQDVPFSVNQNRLKFQAKVDFVVNGATVDVKTATLKSSNKNFKSKRWAFSLKKQESIADFFVLYAIKDDGQSSCYLIPGDMCRFMSTISIPESGGKWADFEVDRADLAPFFSLHGK